VSNDAATGPGATGDGGASRERFTERLAHQWSARRTERVVGGRRPERPVVAVETGPSNFSPAQVPWGLDLAAAWAWRLIVIGVAAYALFRGVEYFAELTIPVIIALLIAALGSPLVAWMEGIGIRRGLGAAIVVLGGLGLVATMLAFAGQQVASGANDLATQVSDGLGEIRNWLNTGPFHVSDRQINDYIQKAQDSLSKKAQSGAFLSQVTNIGSALTHILAGLFLVLFSTYFFLADGDRIWAFFVRIAPRAARARVDSSGRVAWISLTQFVRATVIVAVTDAVGVMIAASILQVQFVLAIGVIVFLGAFVPIVGAFVAGTVAVLVAGTDAIGVMIWAAILGIPFIGAIGVLVFLGAFVPMIGAVLAGTVAVLVALVAKGPVVALLMLAGVVVVQQIEAHVLQPFLMGRFVSVHPLGVIVAIGAGVVTAGIPGALIAVPLAAAVNAVVQHLATYTDVGEEPLDAAEDDPASASLLSDESGEDVADS
jgi:predicted PurR-regulated permease PerM